MYQGNSISENRACQRPGTQVPDFRAYILGLKKNLVCLKNTEKARGSQYTGKEGMNPTMNSEKAGS